MYDQLKSKIFICVAALLILASEANAAVDCYVCSWSPNDVNKTDTCTKSQFQREVIRTHGCEHGCETVAMYDKNDELEIFYRNCVKKEKDKDIPVISTCSNEQMHAYRREVCICSQNLCNGVEQTITQRGCWAVGVTVTIALLTGEIFRV